MQTWIWSCGTGRFLDTCVRKSIVCSFFESFSADLAVITIHGFTVLKYLVSVQPITTSQEMSSSVCRYFNLCVKMQDYLLTNAFFCEANFSLSDQEKYLEHIFIFLLTEKSGINLLFAAKSIRSC